MDYSFHQKETVCGMTLLSDSIAETMDDDSLCVFQNQTSSSVWEDMEFWMILHLSLSIALGLHEVAIPDMLWETICSLQF